MKVILILLAACAATICAIRPQGATLIDLSRSIYESEQHDMWNIVNNANIKKHDVQEKLYTRYKKYIDANWTERYNEYGFNGLKRYYEYSLVEEEILRIQSLWDAFRKFIQNQFVTENFNELAGSEFADTVFHDNKLAINKSLENIYLIMVRQGFYYKVSGEARSTLCSTKQSPQQMLYQLYNVLSITELKGYAMMQFSWMLLKTYGQGNFTKEAEIMKAQFNERNAKTQELLRKVMETSDRTVWRCDPPNHVEGETYEQITRLMQGYIENEVDLNSDGTCMENCAAYQYTESHGCFKDKFCARQPKCNGKILHCRYIDSDMWICPSKSTSHRRYDYIEYENGKILGRTDKCTRGTTKVDSWWRYLFWHCSYCFCLCDEEGKKSDRYISLRESVSDVNQNMVVTGMRFKKVNRILHLQVQQGKLKPRGVIDPETVQWVPVSDFTILDRGIRNGHDYHTFKWDNRSVDFDDLYAKPSHVITGIKFRVIGTHLNMEIRQNEYDFINGKVDTLGEWISNDNTDQSGQPRREIKLKRPNIPTETGVKSLPDSDNNTYMDLTNSDIDKDAAQSTVPFFDIQPLTNEPPVPLAGAGIHHKGRDGSGGFIGVKAMTYDFSPHIQLPQAGDANV